MYNLDKNNQIQDLTEKAKLVMEQYKKTHPNVKMDRDYIPFKITEEWGECLQTYLMLTDRGRDKGKTKEEIKEMMSRESADVFAYILLFAESEGIDLAEAFEKKWMAYIKD